MRHREVKKFTQGHRTSEWLTSDSCWHLGPQCICQTTSLGCLWCKKASHLLYGHYPSIGKNISIKLSLNKPLWLLLSIDCLLCARHQAKHFIQLIFSQWHNRQVLQFFANLQMKNWERVTGLLEVTWLGNGRPRIQVYLILRPHLLTSVVTYAEQQRLWTV